MKKILFGFLFTIAATTFVSCDMNDPNEDKFGVDPQSGWVNFNEADGSKAIVAGCSEGGVPLVLNAPVNENGLEVYFDITDVNGSLDGLEPHAYIPAGSQTGSFYVLGNATAPVEFTVTLTSTNRGNVGIGNPGTDGVETMTVRVLPSTAASSFIAGFDVVETSFEGRYEYESVITQGATENELIISNVYGVSPTSQTRITVNADGTLSFPAFTENYLYTATGGIMRYVEGLSGTFDACTGKMTVNFNLRHGAGGANVAGPYKIVLTRQ